MSNDILKKFYDDRETRISGYEKIRPEYTNVMIDLTRHDYEYNFDFLGRPIIQTPQDIVAMQDLIWKVKPDLIIETGIAHGGSLIMSASMLALLNYCDAVEAGKPLDPLQSQRRVIGIDIDIRAHNLSAIKAHPMAHLIDLIQGSSTAPDVVSQVKEIAANFKRILVCLDSNHTHEHVLSELEVYAPMIGVGSYCCVFDTLVEDLPDDLCAHRPWGKGNSPKTAVWEYLRILNEEGRQASDGAKLQLEIDMAVENRNLLTVAPDGYLKRI